MDLSYVHSAGKNLFSSSVIQKEALTLVEASLKDPHLAEIHTEVPVLPCNVYWDPEQAYNQKGLMQLEEYCQENE